MSIEETPRQYKFGRAPPPIYTDSPRSLKNMKSAAVNLPELKYVNRRYKGKNQTHMNNLINLVGTAGANDIKQVRGAETVKGAQHYIDKRGFKDYKVEHVDIDGDDIKDVIIRDAKGQLYMVNGYTVKKSTLPYRQMYYELPDEEREPYIGNGGYRTYVKEGYYGPTYDPKTSQITGFARDPAKDPFTQKLLQHNMNALIPKSLTPYQVFGKYFIPKLLNYLCDRFGYRTNDEDGNRIPNVHIKFSAGMWKYISFIVLKTLYEGKYNADQIHKFINEDKKGYKQVSKSIAYKNRLQEVLNSMLDSYKDQDEEFLTECNNILYPILAQWYESHQDRMPNEEIQGVDQGLRDMSANDYLIPEIEFVVN